MRKTALFLLFALLGMFVYAQELTEAQKIDERISNLESKVEKLGRLKFSGYIQTQWVWSREDVATGDQNDFSIRRGRLKAAYSNVYGEAVIQIDATEDGVKVKDAYLKIQEPRVPWVALRGGIFNRPFGDEIAYSSSRRESPERSRVFQKLFPKERDLGAELIFTGLENTPLKNVTLHAGLFSGNGGQNKETDSRKDFIGHLVYSQSLTNWSYAIGASLYAGGVRLAGEDEQVAYKIQNGNFVQYTGLESGDYAKRQYYGVDGQVKGNSILGMTSFRAEYLWGTQPGAINGSGSPTGAITSDIYVRKFNGYYLQLAQDLGATKHTLVAKYDAYDPNTKLSKNECLTAGDVKYSTLGLGWLYRANQNLRVMCYYEISSNEKVNNSVVDEKYRKNIKDDVFTLRLQYKF